ncbi:uncharacterized protein LOC143578142 [Bidens hawaiensis]|uniref:uncharacterized protein LOC143578142 n=1 Tax=Bidens hawaiensis TaxID=980011 RepID=UPI00404A1ACC
MGDSSTPPQTREPNTSSFQSPKLTSSNYTVWAMHMRVLMNVHGVWDAIDPGNGDVKRNSIAIALIFQSIPEAHILQVGNLKTAKEMWEALKTRHLGAERVKEAKLQTLMSEFEGLKMKETGTIDDYASTLSSYSSKAATLGELLSEEKMVKKFLTSLPRRFIHIVASLEQVLDLKTVGFDDVVGRESSRGRGRGSYASRGRGRGRDNSHDRSNRDYNKERDDRREKGKERDLSKIKCYRCDKYGHVVSRCPDRFRKDEEANLNMTNENETKGLHASFFMMEGVRETIYLNEDKVMPTKYDSGEDDIWYLDNGESNHMTGETPYEKFKGYKPNLEYLKVFGCIAYERVVSKHLRKLDDWSRLLVYLGSEPGSGGYRMYDPNNKKIVVCIHVDFDEKRGWKWENVTEYDDKMEPGLFTLLWGNTIDFGLGPILNSEGGTEVSQHSEHTSSSPSNPMPSGSDTVQFQEAGQTTDGPNSPHSVA